MHGAGRRGAGDVTHVYPPHVTRNCREYGKKRLELVYKNFPQIDKIIVTPYEMFMEEFLKLFRKTYDDTDRYFREIGLCDEEIWQI